MSGDSVLMIVSGKEPDAKLLPLSFGKRGVKYPPRMSALLLGWGFRTWESFPSIEGNFVS